MSNGVSEVPVTITNWSPTAYTTAGMLIIQVAVLLGIVIRNGPMWLEKWSAARRMSAEDKRQDSDREIANDVRLEARMSAMEDRLSRMSNAVGLLMSASTTTINALETLEPQHPAIRQSRELIGMAASSLGGNDPFNAALQQLATVRGVDE